MKMSEISMELDGEQLHRVIKVLGRVSNEIVVLASKDDTSFLAIEESGAALVSAMLPRNSVVRKGIQRGAMQRFNAGLLERSISKVAAFRLSLVFTAARVYVKTVGILPSSVPQPELLGIQYEFPVLLGETPTTFPAVSLLYEVSLRLMDLHSQMERLSVVADFFQMTPDQGRLTLIASDEVRGNCTISLSVKASRSETPEDGFQYRIEPLIHVLNEIGGPQDVTLGIARRGELFMSTERDSIRYDLLIAAALK
jgi:hypothetical protein